MPEKKENAHEGHRKRLRDKFLRDGNFDSFPPHNVLELLLFYSIPRVDTNELAHRLIETFGSLRGVFDAPYESLLRVPGVGEQTASLIKLIPSLTKVYLEENASDIRYLTSTEDAVRFLKPKFTAMANEALIMVSLNDAGKILKTSVISQGGAHFTEVDVRKIMSELLGSRATAVIIAHNHPGGVCAPSRADHDMTAKLARLLGSIEVTLLNHIIITQDDYFSFAGNPKFADCFLPPQRERFCSSPEENGRKNEKG